MDPNANLKRQREIIAELSKPFDRRDAPVLLQELAELAQTLDQWLLDGGALPHEWLRAAEEDAFVTITRVLAENESRCCDDDNDRQHLAAALVMGLVKP